MDRYATIARTIEQVLGRHIPVSVAMPDGREITVPDAVATIVVRSEEALAHIIRSPGELGFARAYVSGELDCEGDLWAVLEAIGRRPDGLRLTPRQLSAVARAFGVDTLRRPPRLPAEEIDVGGRFGVHTRSRDARAVSHHYDVGNDFYRLLLGPTMVYSCGVFESATDSLEQAQTNKMELICRKLDLQPGQRLLDVGCGWGSLLLHAAEHYGVRGVGITLSKEQAALATERVAAAGLSERVDIRVQDYRDVPDAPFDAVSSVGMFEHVGAAQMATYLKRLHSLVRPGGRVLNHQIGRAPTTHGPARLRNRRRAALDRSGFMHRYVFPDGALHQIGSLVSAVEQAGLEVRHLESIREHYDLTLRHWSRNLEGNWEAAAEASSEGRARVWRLYLAGSALSFRRGSISVHQILAVRSDDGVSGLPWRLRFEPVRLSEPVGPSTEASSMDLRRTDRDRRGRRVAASSGGAVERTPSRSVR